MSNLMSRTVPGPPGGARFVPAGAESWRDPFGMYTALREHEPVHHVEEGDYWVLSRFSDVWSAARDTATFSSAEGLTFTYGERERIGLAEAAPLVMLDPPEHTDFRKLLSSGFTPRRVESIEPMIRRFVAERLEDIGRRASLNSAGSAGSAGWVDIVEELFKPLPSFVVAHYLGVPPADRERFDGWTDQIVAANALGDPLGATRAVAELFDYFSHLMAVKRADPGDDLISSLVQVAGPEDPIWALRVLGFAFTMVAGGNDTTTGLLGGACELLTERPDQRALLLEHPELLGDAIDEFLRLTSPVQGLARTTTTDVTIGGRTIPVGRKVLLLYASANRDPREFGDDADRLEVTRRPRRILAFGHGAHHCLGAAAARLAGRVALAELLARFPGFEVDASAGRYAPGHFVRRYQSLPFRTGTEA